MVSFLHASYAPMSHRGRQSYPRRKRGFFIRLPFHSSTHERNWSVICYIGLRSLTFVRLYLAEKLTLRPRRN